jgi:hypothetical protein
LNGAGADYVSGPFPDLSFRTASAVRNLLAVVRIQAATRFFAW